MQTSIKSNSRVPLRLSPNGTYVPSSCESMTLLALQAVGRSSNSSPPNFTIASGKLFIQGQFRDGVSGEKIDVIDPTTEELLTQVVKGNEEDTEAAIKAAR